MMQYDQMQNYNDEIWSRKNKIKKKKLQNWHPLIISPIDPENLAIIHLKSLGVTSIILQTYGFECQFPRRKACSRNT